MSQLALAVSSAQPDYRRLLQQCIHCGLCLPACPTYLVFGTEMDSPRGRIALITAAADGRIGLDGAFQKHIRLCLACRACDTACPSGVKYAELVEAARIAAEKASPPGTAERLVRWLGLNQAMPHPERLKLVARLLAFYEAIGLQRLVRSRDFLPAQLKAMEALLPPIVPKFQDYRTAAPARGEKRGQVAFFTGCVQEAFLAPVNKATIRVLQRNGYEVHTPLVQTCCGAAHLHVGDDATARDLARKNIDAFLAGNYDAVISNAGGCGVSLKEYPHLLKDDPVYAGRAKLFAAKVKDVNEFLADHLHVPPKGEVKAKVTYYDSCHLRHGQKVAAQPRNLLKGVPGLQLVELKQPDKCCGSAGIYNLVQVDTANAVLDAKMADIAGTGANVIVTSNTGCHMQLIAGARRAGLNAKVMHVVEVLDMSYRAMDGRGA